MNDRVSRDFKAADSYPGSSQLRVYEVVGASVQG